MLLLDLAPISNSNPLDWSFFAAKQATPLGLDRLPWTGARFGSRERFLRSETKCIRLLLIDDHRLRGEGLADFVRPTVKGHARIDYVCNLLLPLHLQLCKILLHDALEFRRQHVLKVQRALEAAAV